MNVRSVPDWHRVLVLYWIASFIEGLGVAQIYAYLPNRLAEVGVARADVPHLVGVLGALFFLTGLDLLTMGVYHEVRGLRTILLCLPVKTNHIFWW